MSLHAYRQRIRILDHHIRIRSRGNIKCIAGKLELSIPGAYKFLQELREEGIPVAYSKKENRFYYNKPGQMIGYMFVPDDENSWRDRGGGGIILKDFLIIKIVEFGKVTLSFEKCRKSV